MDSYKKIKKMAKEDGLFDAIFGQGDKTSSKDIDNQIQLSTYELTTNFDEITDNTKQRGVVLKNFYDVAFNSLKRISSDKNNLKLNFDQKSFIGKGQDFMTGIAGVSGSTLVGLMAIPRKARRNSESYKKHFIQNIIPHLYSFLKNSASYKEVVENAFKEDVVQGEKNQSAPPLKENTKTILTKKDGALLVPSQAVVQEAKEKNFAEEVSNDKDIFISKLGKLPELDKNRFAKNKDAVGFGSRIQLFHIKLSESDSVLQKMFKELDSMGSGLSKNMTVGDILKLYDLSVYASEVYQALMSIISNVIFEGQGANPTSKTQSKAKGSDVQYRILRIEIPTRNNMIRQNSSGKFFFDNKKSSDGKIKLTVNQQFYDDIRNSGVDQTVFIVRFLEDKGLMSIRKNKILNDEDTIRDSISASILNSRMETTLTFDKSKLDQMASFANQTDDISSIITFQQDRKILSISGPNSGKAEINATLKRKKIINKYGEAVTAPLYSYKDESGNETQFTVYDLIKNRGKIKDSSGKKINPLKKSKPKSLSSIVNSWKPKGK